MGKGNKSVGQVHPIIKHMNNLGGNPEIKYDPISHDEKGMGRGGHLGSPLNQKTVQEKIYPKGEHIVKDKNTNTMVRRKKLSPNQPT